MIICFDTESAVGYTADGVLSVVCMTYAYETDKTNSQIVDAVDAVDLWLSWVRDPDVTLLCHSAAHDMCVMAQAANPGAEPGTGWAYELAWQAYDDERVRCSYIRQRLLDIAAGQGKLAAGLSPLVERYGLGTTQEKKPRGVVKDWLKMGAPIREWPDEVRELAPARVSYGLWKGLPFDQWPPHALQYALDDPKFCWGVYDAQPAGVLVDEMRQTRAAFDLEILSKRGWLTDRPRVQRLLALYGGVMAECYQVMIETGLVAEKRVWPESDPRHRVDRTLSTKAIQALVWDALGTDAPITKTARKSAAEHEGDLEWYAAHISCEADICTSAVAARGAEPVTIVDAVEHFERGDLRAWLDASRCASINARRMYMKARHNVGHYLGPLDTDRRVRSYYTPLLETGRTSTARPCLNYPRDADKPEDLAIRGCIVPDDGWPFLVVDYAQLELCTLAQTLTHLGRSRTRDRGYLSPLAIAINNGMDCHIMVAANILGMSYAECEAIYKTAKPKKPDQRTELEQLVCNTRQVSKIGNYGYGGGMGAKTFVGHAAKQGQLLTLAQAERVKDAVKQTWELQAMFDFVSAQCKRSAINRCSIRLPWSGRIRGGCYYTEANNYMFQGPASDGCKLAIKRVNDACFREPESPLFGARPVAFIHDELIVAQRDPLAFLRKNGTSFGEAWQLYSQIKATGDTLGSMIVYEAERGLHELERHMVEAMEVITPDVKITAEGHILTERWSK